MYLSYLKTHIKRAQDSCMIWPFGLLSGYGRLRIGREQYVHRIAFALHSGKPVPKGMMVLHSCDTPACFNPRHLFLGTQFDNMRDAQQKDRLAKGSYHGRSKLTEKQVLEIRQSKESNVVLGRRYGVKKQTIGRIKRGIRWGWLCL